MHNDNIILKALNWVNNSKPSACILNLIQNWVLFMRNYLNLTLLLSLIVLLSVSSYSSLGVY